ncbi:hypothetical protein H8356DRAFT_1053275 [Neocallimastix lanati (nom. inval.)]|uniref:GOLD domain-containing protein n=1 Tax=Neocallimastix californiae TaxID=1754190 RepID=A0A1Y2DB90_9FUNG|nr:hypothetical protein H8356DRAFT_1053275 [Neocallimastix sp. JGI-2020a]ORY56528.1 hypothetical protein LY90DRAFT_506784 [Neocallimastix californiae]|eukprot:ORY56528.1 hypothetical protein LY90DRAFT_506784 [Neocallimastix californiae]
MNLKFYYLITLLLAIGSSIQTEILKPEDNICNAFLDSFNFLPFMIDNKNFIRCKFRNQYKTLSCKSEINYMETVTFDVKKFKETGNCDFNNCFKSKYTSYLTIYNDDNSNNSNEKLKIIENIESLDELNKEKIYLLNVVHKDKNNQCKISYSIQNGQISYDNDLIFSNIIERLNKLSKLFIGLLSIKIFNHLLKKKFKNNKQ